MKRMKLEEIREFFVRRPFARPADWTEINAKTIDATRARDLTCFINGYKRAKDERPTTDAEVWK